MNSKHYIAVLAELTFQTALHVGVGRGRVGTDAPLRRSLRGEILLPGTALAGALRTTATRLTPGLDLGSRGRRECLALHPSAGSQTRREVCGCSVCHLFGELHPSEAEDESKGGRASRLWVYDSPLKTGVPPFIRDGVGIDRSNGAAARAGRVKFDQEILPAGAVFPLRLELEAPEEADELLLAAVLAEWQAGRAWLGGGAGRGLGKATLGPARWLENELDSGDRLLDYLKATDPISSAEEKPGWLLNRLREARTKARTEAERRPFIEVELQIQIEGLFLTQDMTASGMLGFDHVSLLDGAPGWTPKAQPLLPGSGLRGALRSHAERIARTLAAYHASRESSPLQAFLDTCPACNPLQDDPGRPLTKCSEINALKRYAEVQEEQLCLACRLFGSSQRGSRLRVMDAPLEGEPLWKAVDFLAIDRFTGGALEGAKFDAAALWRPKFRARLFLEEPEDWELGWLALTLRDLSEGRMALGFGAAKGFGRATGAHWTICCGFLGDKEWGGQAVKNESKEAPGFYRRACFREADWAGLQETVSGWIGAFITKADQFRREPGVLPSLKADTYFEQVDKLYPIYRKESSHE